MTTEAGPGAAEPAGLKHWRSFGADEWRHVKDGALGLLLGTLVPVGLFYACYRTWSLSVGVAAGGTWAAQIFVWHWRRTESPDVFSATTFVFACVKAGTGLISQSSWLYLAFPSLENLIY